MLQFEEKLQVSRSKARLEHLQALVDEVEPHRPCHTSLQGGMRLDRLATDYMLRKGLISSAQKLSAKKNIEELVDIAVFNECKVITDALLAHSTEECLTWCAEHKTILRKMKVCNCKEKTISLPGQDGLEFDLRKQEYVELVRSSETTRAIQHAQKHLAPVRDIRTKEVDQAAALLCFDSSTSCEPYKVTSRRPGGS